MRKFVWIALVFFIILCCGREETTITINNPRPTTYPTATPTYVPTPTATPTPTTTPVVTPTPTTTPKPPKCKKIRIKYCTNYCRKGRRQQYKCCNWAHIKICK